MSDWVETLRRERDRIGGKAAARAVGISETTVSQLLSGTYKGNWKRMQSRVEGALMGTTVECPVAGDIPRDRCMDHQTRPFSATSPMRVQLSRTCPTCPNFVPVKPAKGAA